MSSTTETPISPVTGSRPELTISAPSINAEPVELDSSPVSPENMRNGRRASKPEALEALSPEEKERRAKLIHERQSNPAVLVDIPKTPGAEEFNRSEDAEATVSDKTSGKESS